MDQNLIVISASEQIRSSFLDSYSLLGYEVTVSADIVEVIRDLNQLDPDHVVMDVEELPRRWKVVAAGLQLAQKKITLVLLSEPMTLEQAHEALMLGVTGIVVKPFQPEFHLRRVYEILHRRLRAEGRRLYPRFYAGTAFEGELELASEAAGKRYRFELVNVSETGAAVRTRDTEAAQELQPGAMIEKALMRIDNQDIRLSAEVVFRNQGLVGIRFDRFSSGEANFRRLLQRLSLRAFGISGIKGQW